MQAIPSGFETVYRREFPFVWSAARRLGVPPAAIDDAVQDVFLTAYRRWDDLDYEVSPRAWLYGVTRRVAFRYRRTQARTSRRRSVIGAAGPTRHEPHARLEGAHDVDAVLASLEAGRREVFVMSELLDMSGPEIAAELKIPLNTVYSRLRLARRQLERTVTRTEPFVRAARRHGRPPAGQARRSWAVLVPAIRGGIWAGTVGTASASKLAGIGAMVVLVGGVVLTGALGSKESRAGARASRAGSVGVEAKVSRSVAPTEASPRPAASPASAPEPSPGEPSVQEAVDTTRSRPGVAAARSQAAPRHPAPSKVVTPVPEAAPPSAPGEDSSLTDEVAVLDRATGALRSGQAARALQWLAEHERRFPAGRLADVRKATRVRVLCELGREPQARAQAVALRQEHPRSAVAQQVPHDCEKDRDG